MYRVMFVCYANVNRSKTGASVLKKMLEREGLEASCEIESSGLDVYCEELSGRKQLTRELADSFEIIFSADENVTCSLILKYQQPRTKIKTLDIPDIYKRDDLALVQLLEEKLTPFVEALKEDMPKPHTEPC